MSSGFVISANHNSRFRKVRRTFSESWLPVGSEPGSDRTFVGSSVGSVWIWRYPIDSPVTTSVGPKKQSVDVGSRSWSHQVGRSSLSQISEKSRSGTRASQDRPGFYYVDVTRGAVTGKWYISK